MSDSGQVVALRMSGEGRQPIVVRLVNPNGEVLADYPTHPTQVRFTGQGLPVVFGPDPATQRLFIALLNAQGEEITRHVLDDPNASVFDVVPSFSGDRLFLFLATRPSVATQRIGIWDTAGDVVRSVPTPIGPLGAVQIGHTRAANNGAYLAIRIGSNAVALIDANTGTVLFQRAYETQVEGAGTVHQITQIQVDDAGTVTAKGYARADDVMSDVSIKLDRDGEVIEAVRVE